jgi:hypothetical protein
LRDVLVDTSVWSVALRRQPTNQGAHEKEIIFALDKLALDGSIVLIGAIRQEALSGIKYMTNNFLSLKNC